jgi:hypothetical protein
VKYYRHVPRVSSKIGIGGEDRQADPVSDRANEKIHTAPCYAIGPASVEEPCSHLIVGPMDGDVVEVGQPLAKPLEVALKANAGENFLTDRANEMGSPVTDHISPFLDESDFVWIQVTEVSTQR